MFIISHVRDNLEIGKQYVRDTMEEAVNKGVELAISLGAKEPEGIIRSDLEKAMYEENYGTWAVVISQPETEEGSCYDSDEIRDANGKTL